MTMKNTTWKRFLIRRFLLILVLVGLSEKLLNLCYGGVVYPWLEHTLHMEFFLTELGSEQNIIALCQAGLYLGFMGICSQLPEVVGIGLRRWAEQWVGSQMISQLTTQTEQMSQRETQIYLLGMTALTILILLTLILPYVIAAVAFSRMVETQRKRLEEQERRQREEYDRRRNLLLSDVAHDLKTPMTTVAGYAKVLLEEEELQKNIPGSEKEEPQKNVPESAQEESLYSSPGAIHNTIDRRREYLETIYSKSMQMSGLLNLLFEYVKLDSEGFQLKKTEEDLWELLRECVANLYMDFEEKGMEIFPEIPEEEVRVQIDRVQFQRVVTNLLNNAIRHNPQGTKVWVEAEAEEEHITIRVCDTGTPIPEETAKYIFDPFVLGDESRNSKNGSGLGLSIAKKVIEMHGGSLTLEQEEGEEYTKTFVIRLNREG